MKKRRSIALALALTATVGCASSAPVTPAPAASRSPAAPESLGRVVVVPWGDSRFAVARAEQDPTPIFNAIFNWLPYKNVLVPIAQLVYAGVTSFLESDRAAGTRPDVVPAALVAEAFTRALRESGTVSHIVTTSREPVGDARRDAEVVVRVAVPSWGLVHVRNDQVSGFADVRVEVVRRETGRVLWTHEEDVTHPERFAADALKKDQALTRELLMEVLGRAGRRVANELVYVRNRAP